MVNIHQIDIRTLLPQRPPMVMVDCLLSADLKTAVTSFAIRADNLFVENGALKPYALMENIAQTCAAQLGYADVYLNGQEDVRIGYIGAVKRMQIEATPRVGETLRTCMEVVEDFGDMKLVVAESFVGERKIATTEMTIALSGERIEG